jgi:hypothetical protein
MMHGSTDLAGGGVPRIIRQTLDKCPSVRDAWVIAKLCGHSVTIQYSFRVYRLGNGRMVRSVMQTLDLPSNGAICHTETMHTVSKQAEIDP